VFAPLVGAPLLMSNAVTLLLAELATYKRVPAGFTARATGAAAPGGRAVFAPLVGAPLLMSNAVTLLVAELATYSDWSVRAAVGVAVAVAVAVGVGLGVGVAEPGATPTVSVAVAVAAAKTVTLTRPPGIGTTLGSAIAPWHVAVPVASAAAHDTRRVPAAVGPGPATGMTRTGTEPSARPRIVPSTVKLPVVVSSTQFTIGRGHGPTRIGAGANVAARSTWQVAPMLQPGGGVADGTADGTASGPSGAIGGSGGKTGGSSGGKSGGSSGGANGSDSQGTNGSIGVVIS